MNKPGLGRLSRPLRLAAVVGGGALVVVVALLLWQHVMEHGRSTQPPNLPAEWIRGYATNADGTELIIVLVVCQDSGLDEAWTITTNPERVEVYIAWWGYAPSNCDYKEARHLTFPLDEPLGDRGVYEMDGGKILPFEGKIPTAVS